jgi:hypothetical protein
MSVTGLNAGVKGDLNLKIRHQTAALRERWSGSRAERSKPVPVDRDDFENGCLAGGLSRAGRGRPSIFAVCFVFLIGFDNFLNQMMTHHIGF